MTYSRASLIWAKWDKLLFFALFTPHAQCEWGKVIDRGVHIYIYITEKPFTSK